MRLDFGKSLIRFGQKIKNYLRKFSSNQPVTFIPPTIFVTQTTNDFLVRFKKILQMLLHQAVKLAAFKFHEY